MVIVPSKPKRDDVQDKKISASVELDLVDREELYIKGELKIRE